MSELVCGIHPEACQVCEHLERCGGMDDDSEIRECDNSCPHFDSLNLCCWQAGPWGLCFDRSEGDPCRLGYKEDDGR